MAADIAQLDAIIGKFLDYARPGNEKLSVVVLREVIDTCLFSLRNRPDLRVKLDMTEGLQVLADAVELGRVITNLLENAIRYGKSVDTGIAVVDIAAKARDKWVLLRVRDHGMGVSAEQLGNLTKPFYRGEAARTAANGAGLGLAIVDKTISHMGGTFLLSNTTTSGLAANIKLQRAPAG
jgi:two-component system osmolarity sensor histidine kinase EnvZ